MSGARNQRRSTPAPWVVFVLIAGAAIALWWLASAPATEHTADLPNAIAPSGEVLAATVEQPAARPTDNLAPPHRTPVVEVPRPPGLLHLSVLDADDNPVAVRIHYAVARSLAACMRTWQSPQPARAATPAAARSILSAQRTPDDAIEAEAGACELQVPPDHWTWVCATDSRRRSRYLQVPPFEGNHRATIRFEARRGVHIMVHADDLRGARAGVALELSVATPSLRRGDGEVVWRGVSDVHGHAYAEVQRDGTFVARIAGEGGPHISGTVCAVVVHPASPEAMAALVVPEPSVPCTFRLTSDTGDLPQGVAWLLRRTDPGREVLMPLATAGAPSTVELRLPQGTYRPQVAPHGSVVVANGDGGIEVGAERKNEWTLTWRPSRSREVQLAGVPASALPVVVRWTDDDDLGEPIAPQTWVGAPRWRGLEGSIALPGGRARLVAESRIGCWTGAALGDLFGAVVELRPACALVVDAPIEGDHELCVEVEHAHGTTWRTLRATLAAGHGGQRARLRGGCVVPHGPANVFVRAADGRLMYERRLELVGAQMVVSTDG